MILSATERFSLRIIYCATTIFIFQMCFLAEYDYYHSLGSSYINFPDHEFYKETIEGKGLSATLSSVNNYSVSNLYKIAHSIFGLNITLLSMIFNFFVMTLAYAKLEFICFNFSKRFLPVFYCLAITATLQFSVLINKDSFSLLFYVFLASFLITRKNHDLFLVLLLMPIRVQFLIIFIFSLILTIGNGDSAKLKILLKTLLLYILCSTIALIIEKSESLLSHEHYAENGVSYWISKLNSEYFAGSYLLNFLKPAQYVYDLYRGATYNPSFVGGVIFFSKLIFLLLIIFNSHYFIRLIYTPWTYFENRNVFCISALISSFFLVYIISPVIHYRYLIDISPLIIFFFFLRGRMANSHSCLTFHRSLA